MKHYLYILFFLCISSHAVALQSEDSHWMSDIDSLSALLHESNDTSRIDIYLKLSKNLQPFLPDSAVTLIDNGLEIAQKYKLKHYEADLLFEKAEILTSVGKFTEANQAMKNALEVYSNVENNQGVLNASLKLGAIKEALGELETAVLYYQSALMLSKSLRNQIAEIEALTSIGHVFYLQGLYEDAKGNLSNAINVGQAVNYSKGIGKASLLLGHVYYRIKEYTKALESYKTAENYINSLNIQFRIDCYKNLSDLYYTLQDNQKALNYLRKYYEANSQYIEDKNRTKLEQFERRQLLSEETAVVEYQARLKSNINYTRTILIIGVVIIVLLLIIVTISFLSGKKKKKWISEVNAQLSDTKSQLEKTKKELKERDDEIDRIVRERTESLYNELEERRQVDIELKKALKKAEDANYLKNAFLSNMSHEIRTPLNGIIGFSSLLVTELSLLENQELYEYANGISQSGERLLHLLNNIIDISRIEANDLEVNLKPVFANEVVRNVSELYSFKANEKGLKFNTKLTEIPKVYADEAQLTKVVNELIDNATKYTEKGFINVVTNFSKKDKLVQIIVKDTGIGIDNAFLDHIFEAFRQESLGYSRTYQGAGLGLPLAKKMIDLMNGNIEVNSEKGYGTTVTISLKTELEQLAQPVQEKQEDEKPKVDKKKEVLDIFIVEDDRMNRLVLSKMLEKVGKNVLAVDGEETMKIMADSNKKGHVFDVMLFDINLPAPWDGVKLMKAIKEKYKDYAHIPFIAQTAYAMSGDKERLLDAGFDNYLSKPVNKNELINMIYKEVELSQNKTKNN